MTDVLITPGSRKIEFFNAGDSIDATISTDVSGNLSIQNPGGDIAIGDVTGDVFVGDGINSVDLVFEQSGAIFATSGNTLTLGTSGADLVLTGSSITINNATTLDQYGINTGTINADSATIKGGSIFFDSAGNSARLQLTHSTQQSSDVLQVQTDDGYILIGAQNTAYAHIVTDRPRFYFGQTIMAGNNKVTSYDNNLQLQRNETTKLTLNAYGATVTGTMNADSATISGQGVIGGNGSTGGVTIDDGAVTIRTGTGSVAYVDFYCEVSNAHRTRLKSAAHSAYSGNVDVTLPTSTGTLALTSQIPTNNSGLTNGAGYMTASSTNTLTNKTFNVEGTGNSISNIDVADFKAAAIVTESEGIGSNDNDTTLPTSAAVKDYVDNNAAGSTVIVQDEGSALSTAATTLNFTGAGVTASGTGATKTVNIPGGSDGVTVQDEGSALSTTGTTLNFVGSGVTASGTGATKTITIPGGGTASDITITANNSTNETVYLTFVDGATGTQGLETDTGLSYNPSTGLISTAALTATGDVTAANFVSSSDIRLKGNIEDIDGAINKVMQLRGVSYVKQDRKEIGVIAQEIEEVIPEVVHTAADGYKSVAYGNIVGLLIEAIKDLQTQVDELKANK